MFDIEKNLILIVLGVYIFYLYLPIFEPLIIRNKTYSPEEFDFTRFDCISLSLTFQNTLKPSVIINKVNDITVLTLWRILHE